jgi:hypothetical protein
VNIAEVVEYRNGEYRRREPKNGYRRIQPTLAVVSFFYDVLCDWMATGDAGGVGVTCSKGILSAASDNSIAVLSF